MSKSLKRVELALEQAGYAGEIVETKNATTAMMAASELGCDVDQIAKSVMLQGLTSTDLFLFITAGKRMVDIKKAQSIAGEELTKADANTVRKITGFAIGGVSPIGHKKPPATFMDAHLFQFDIIWAAAGTPRHVFSAAPNHLLEISNAVKTDFSK